ncbi:MAG: hypothetical protein ACRDVM_08720, partial [Acidimicrobiia bacterium]
VNAPAAAWDDAEPAGALSFGFHEVADRRVTTSKVVRVRNYSDAPITYNVSSSFRFEDDQVNGAVSLRAPRRVMVPANGDATFTVTLTVTGTLLRNNLMNSGSNGANPVPLTTNEYDGYLVLDDGANPIHLAWHVLPRKAAEVVPQSDTLEFNDGTAVVGLANQGVGTAQNNPFSLVALSDNLPEGGRGEQAPTPDFRAIGINTFPVPAGFCSDQDSFVWAFAVNTWERQTHADVPGIYWFDLDADQDGEPEFAVFNYDLAFLGSVADGRNVTWALDYATGEASAFFFTEHAVNTANTTLYICGEQVGMSGTDLGVTNVGVTAFAFDIYFGGPGDQVDGITITPGGERYVGSVGDIAGQSSGELVVTDTGPTEGNTPELGVLLFTNSDRGSTSRGGATADTEALIFTAGSE